MRGRDGAMGSERVTSATAGRVFIEFLRLGCTSFGGPIAHIGYFRNNFVTRLKWIGEADFADLLALCQFLPGPASSQLGMAIGLEKAGMIGAGAAFVGFTLPSALLMTVLALGLGRFGGHVDPGLLAGLAVVAFAVVADAVRGMASTLARGRLNAAIALSAAAVCIAVPGSAAQIAVLVAGGVVGVLLAKIDPAAGQGDVPHQGLSRRAALVALGLFAALLVGLPVLAGMLASPMASFINALYRSGALVFGGGHVVLPLLQDATVGAGMLPLSTFMAGYGAVQAAPGPLFSFAAFLGASIVTASPLFGALIATVALFAPAFLLIVGAMPFWHQIKRVAAVRRALGGVNAAVVGLLGAALYDPIFVGAIRSPREMVLAIACFGLMTVGRVPAWLVVPMAGAAGWIWLAPAA